MPELKLSPGIPGDNPRVTLPRFGPYIQFHERVRSKIDAMLNGALQLKIMKKR